FSWRKLWRYAGPGWLMAIAYLDPGNLESDLQSGSIAGYQLIWLLFWTHAVGFVIQCLAAKLGVVTGRHLAEHANDADIQEIIGTAVALRILFNCPIWAGVLITAVDSFLFLMLQSCGVRILEAFFMALIGTMAVCFWVEMGLSQPRAVDILRGLVIPRVPKAAITQAVGMVGAVIMPHNIFLHSALVMSRKINRSRNGPTPRQSPSQPAEEAPPSRASYGGIREATFYFRIESGVALVASFLINMAIMVVFARVFYDPDQPDRSPPGLYDAADVLQHALGSTGARYLWAIGLLAAGQSSTMTGTMAGQYVMEGFWQWKIKPWQRVAITRSIALVPSLIVAAVASENFDSLGEILNVLQSIQLPFALVPVIKLTNATQVV
ncbi:natural resistance-associated macrophage protein-domain-containing protein, partial [Dimargaris cristalligena]